MRERYVDANLELSPAPTPQRISGLFRNDHPQSFPDPCPIVDQTKRSPRGLELSYEELDEGVPDGCSVEAQVDARELGRHIDRFLRSLPEKDRCIFLRRYWYMDTHRQIAHRYHMTEGSVKGKLHKIRSKLKLYLRQEGYTK